jgi:hypothetical protein
MQLQLGCATLSLLEDTPPHFSGEAAIKKQTPRFRIPSGFVRQRKLSLTEHRGVISFTDISR